MKADRRNERREDFPKEVIVSTNEFDLVSLGGNIHIVNSYVTFRFKRVQLPDGREIGQCPLCGAEFVFEGEKIEVPCVRLAPTILFRVPTCYGNFSIESRDCGTCSVHLQCAQGQPTEMYRVRKENG